MTLDSAILDIKTRPHDDKGLRVELGLDILPGNIQTLIDYTFEPEGIVYQELVKYGYFSRDGKILKKFSVRLETTSDSRAIYNFYENGSKPETNSDISQGNRPFSD